MESIVDIIVLFQGLMNSYKFFHATGQTIRLILAVPILVSVILYNYFLLGVYVTLGYLPLQVFDLRWAIYAMAIVFFMGWYITRNRQSTNEDVLNVLIKRLSFLVVLMWFGYFIFYRGAQPTIPNSTLLFRDVICIIFFNIMLFWLSWLVFRTCFFKNMKCWVLVASKIGLIFLNCFVIQTIWMGYLHLGVLWSINMVITLIALMMIRYLCGLLNKLYTLLTSPEHKIGQTLYSALGKRPNGHILELSILRYLGMFMVCVFFAVGICEIWGATIHHVEKLAIELVMHGAYLFEIQIFPIRILRAITLFCVMMLLGKILLNTIIKNRPEHAEGLLHITSALLHGVLLCVVLLIALFIAGINTSSLLFISGGLSFGIGFGLKQFASNGISGLYLAVDKCYKVGDYISIDDVSGVVKKIGLLSTCISKDAQSDVIIPNGNVLDTQITKYRSPPLEEKTDHPKE